MTATKWHYCGDVNLEYGGTFIDLSTFAHGYCSAVRVTDLDSACGFRGAVLIEHIVINGTDDAKRIKTALQCVGYQPHTGRNGGDGNDTPELRKTAIRHQIADALMSYGFTDPDDSWDGYASHHSEVVQLEADGPMAFDGWKADKRLRNTDLRAYVESVHLRD